MRRANRPSWESPPLPHPRSRLSPLSDEAPLGAYPARQNQSNRQRLTIQAVADPGSAGLLKGSGGMGRAWHLYDFPKIHDPRGNLTFIEGERHIPFAIRR